MKTGARIVPDALLERYLADVLPAEARSEIEALLARSPEERARLEELRAGSAAFLLKHPPESLVARFQEEERQRQLQRKFPEAVLAQAAKASRIKRAMTVGSIVFLALLVAASWVALVATEQQARMARAAEAKALRTAEEASKAAEDAKRRLAEVEAKDKQLRDALRAEEKARKELMGAYAQLQDTNAQLMKALNEVSEAQKRARSASELATHNEAAARRAEMVARKAEQEALQTAEQLRREQEEAWVRIGFLEQQIGSIGQSLE